VADPSTIDGLITKRIRESLQLVYIRLLGHSIVAGTDTVSFAEKGLILNPVSGKLLSMTTELDVLRRVSEGLSAHNLTFMMTGSFALAHYATPRMTRDVDIVVAVNAPAAETVIAELSTDFYVDPDSVRTAIQSERMFNMMHLSSAIKIDFIVRKSSAYRLTEFARRQPITMGSVPTWSSAFRLLPRSTKPHAQLSIPPCRTT
jgi:hypothetical protein